MKGKGSRHAQEGREGILRNSDAPERKERREGGGKVGRVKR